ncbi:hypothetical protein [Micromonospora sp. B9E7]|uniref:hypothetical protein n=1 Tax=Micromonospora sp. B9E7 TaxID=3153574 RepID=UPI00325CB6A6
MWSTQLKPLAVPPKTPGQPVRALTSSVTLPAAADVTVAAYRVWDEVVGLLTLVVRRVWWWSLVRPRRSAAG